MFRDAASKLTGLRRRAFKAKATVELLGGRAWRAESCFGWNRHPVELGLREQASGIVCLDNFPAHGSKTKEAKRLELERDIRALTNPHSQGDPQFRNALSYTRLSTASRSLTAAGSTLFGHAKEPSSSRLMSTHKPVPSQ